MNNNLDYREKRNLILFIISYLLNNIVSGFLYDTYVNYLQEVSISIATSFWSFYGYATFISAFFLFFVPKIGYKKLVIFCSIACTTALFAAIWLKSEDVFVITTLLALVGVQLHFIMLAPYVATYTENCGDNRIKWYTRTYYIGYVGYFLSTYLGGVITVKMFASHASITYSAAKKITEYISDVGPSVKEAYLQGNKDVLLLVGIISAFGIIPAILIKEERKDYKDISNKLNKKTFKERTEQIIKLLLNKDAIIYLTYWSIISFAMGLFTSYFTVFLNRNLHIDKATSSLLVSISYIAIVVFMFFTPYVVKKLGRVGTICSTLLISIPFMLIIANGDMFGGGMVPVVGFALFMRSGLANIGSPAESAINMSIPPKELRPAFTSIINFLAGFVSIVSGYFTGKILFVNQEGYRTAYYIAAVLYLIACAVMYFGLQKYNREKENWDEL